MGKIQSIYGQQIYDSRGAPTLEVTVSLNDGTKASASVPSGAYTGRYEAKIINDFKAVLNTISSLIGPSLQNHEIVDQAGIDRMLLELDGTPDKSNLGGNTILGVSLACARAASQSAKTPLYIHIGRIYDPNTPQTRIPTPMFNLLNGGKHADNNLPFQEFMVVPIGNKRFADKMQTGLQIFHKLKEGIKKIGKSTAVGEEGGFAPALNSNEEALELVINAVMEAGFTPREEVAVGLDVAAGAISDLSAVTYPHKPLDYYQKLFANYPLSILEDPFPEDDWDNWAALTKKLGSLVSVVGDDLFSTNLQRLREGIELGAANAISIKPNQIGTLTETLEAVREARMHKMAIMVSHRAGETEDTFIADLAVGVGAEYIKAGAPNRGERIAKYNQVLRIERELGL